MPLKKAHQRSWLLVCNPSPEIIIRFGEETRQCGSSVEEVTPVVWPPVTTTEGKAEIHPAFVRKKVTVSGCRA